MPTKKGSAAQEEAQARASVRDQIAYEHPGAKNIPAGPLAAAVGAEETEGPKTLFERTQDAQRVYWELLSDLEDSLDVEIDGTSDLQSMTLDELKSRRGKSQCNGTGCETMVGPRDPYFATPCGSYCSECMETEHAPGCGICASEFDLEASDEAPPSDDAECNAQHPENEDTHCRAHAGHTDAHSDGNGLTWPNLEQLRAAAQRGHDAQTEAGLELEALLPGVIERKSIATGTNAIFGPNGQCLAFNWVDALRVSKEATNAEKQP